MNHKELRAAAEAAKQVLYEATPDELKVCEDYMALADPATVLALLEENAKLRAALERFWSAWNRAESNRGVYSCTPMHDMRCCTNWKEPSPCNCGRDELESAAGYALASAMEGQG